MNFTKKKIQWIGLLLLAGFTTTTAALYFDLPARWQTKPAAAASGSEFVCPMHPEVMSTRAGDCTKCGMALVVASAVAASPAGCGGGPEDSCCARKAATGIQLPPGHPPIPGYTMHSGCDTGAVSSATSPAR